jgi:hypothetical protein
MIADSARVVLLFAHRRCAHADERGLEFKVRR